MRAAGLSTPGSYVQSTVPSAVPSTVPSSGPYAPTFASTTTPRPPGPGVCKLDAYRGDGDAGAASASKLLSSMRELVKQNFGLSDEEIDTMVSQAGGRVAAAAGAASNRVFGDLSQCAAVKTNRLASIVQLGIMGAIVVATGFAMRTRGGGAAAVRAVEVLGAVGVAVTAFQMRHTISLVSKLTWHGSGPNTRRTLVLTAAGAAASVALAYFKGARAAVVVPLLAAVAAVTLAKMYYLARAVANPEATYLVALVSAVDRTLSHEKMSEARRQYAQAVKRARR